jgi:hypothetical protein
MLSSPNRRFAWSRSERLAEFSFFRALIIKRRYRRPPIKAAKERAGKRWKPAPWTPWLWMK